MVMPTLPYMAKKPEKGGVLVMPVRGPQWPSIKIEGFRV